MNVILVLGKRATGIGEIDHRFRAGVGLGIQLLMQDQSAIMVISGGVTRRGCLSEAESVLHLVHQRLDSRVRLEMRSLSTRQNILFSKKLITNKLFDDEIRGKKDKIIDSIIVISSPAHEAGVRFAFSKAWPEIMDRFSYQAAGKDTVWETLKYGLVYCIRRIDPYDKVFFPIKKWFLF